jgi:S-adenosylmethionine:tRNA ribosyltransferase-isomerase
MHPKNLSIKDFTYSLPEEKIAEYPLAERDTSRLLVYKEGKITEDVYKNIAQHIPPRSLLVFNNSKVIEARLLFQKPTGGVVEIFCLEPGQQYPDITTAMLQQKTADWLCLVGGASKWKHGQILEKKIETANGSLVLAATYIEKRTGSFLIRLEWQPAHLSFAEVLHHAGAIPLPPYIKRAAEAIDKERYQTIFANHHGSVAAPTAGLHFTYNIFESLDAKKISHEFITLHVGAGTFKPVKSETMAEHDMHAEYFEVTRSTIQQILQTDTVIPVGTTSLRTLESLYWLGVGQLAIGSRQLTVEQWDPYDSLETTISKEEALEALLAWMDNNKTDIILAKTSIIIAPGYQPRIAKALVTNFHQPQSTLLLLVAALVGKDWKKIYEYALQHGFRFLSYGDGCVLWISP